LSIIGVFATKLDAKQEVAACDISMPPEPEFIRKLIPYQDV
jgi:hypothetical protein